MRHTVRTCIVRAAAIGALSAGVVHAQQGPGPPASDDGPEGSQTQEVADARDAFRIGVDLAKQGRWSDALDAFERSNRLRPHVVTLYNVGFCERKIGRLTRGRLALSRALSQGGTGEAALPESLRVPAEQNIGEIDALLGTATIQVDTPGTKLLVDGMPLEAQGSDGSASTFFAGTREPGAPEELPVGSVVVRVDPGTHVFKFFSKDHAEPDVVRTFAPGETLAVSSSPALDVRPAVGVTAPEQNATTAAPARSHSPWPLRISLGVAAAGVATGATFGILALTTSSDLSHVCPNHSCPPGHRSELSRLGTYSDAATAGFVVGGVALAVAGFLWFESPRSVTSPAPKHGVRIHPWLGDRAAGVFGDF